MNRTKLVCSMKDMFSEHIREKQDKINAHKERKERLNELLQDKTLPYSTYKSYEMELESLDDVIRFLVWELKSWMDARSAVYGVMQELDIPINIQVHSNYAAS